MKIDYNQMMKQMEKMQQDIAKAQEELKGERVEASSGGGMVKVTADGQGKVLGINISQEALGSDDKGIVEDMVLVAVNEALDKSRDVQEQKLRGLTGGLNIPGLT